MSWNCIYGGCPEAVGAGRLLYCREHDPNPPPRPEVVVHVTTRPIHRSPLGTPEYEALKAQTLAEIRETRG